MREQVAGDWYAERQEAIEYLKRRQTNGKLILDIQK